MKANYISTIPADKRDEQVLNVVVNSFEEAVKVFATYFGVKEYKISKSKYGDKTFKIGQKFYTKDRYYVSQYVQFLVGKVIPSNVKFTLAAHGNKLAMQLIYYTNNRVNEYDWVYGIYEGNSYKYGQETLLDWINGVGKVKVGTTDYKKYIQY